MEIFNMWLIYDYKLGKCVVIGDRVLEYEVLVKNILNVVIRKIEKMIENFIFN